MIYADFQSILVPDDNGKQNPNESHTNKYKKYVACSYGYKLVCADDKFSKPFKLYLGKDAVYNFISSMVKGSSDGNIVGSRKGNIVVMWWKNILTRNL